MNRPYSSLSNPYYVPRTSSCGLRPILWLGWNYNRRRRSAVYICSWSVANWPMREWGGIWKRHQRWWSWGPDPFAAVDDYVALNWLSLSILCEPDILIWESAQDLTSQQWTIVDNNSSATSSFGSSHNRWDNRRRVTLGKQQTKQRTRWGRYLLHTMCCRLPSGGPMQSQFHPSSCGHYYRWGWQALDTMRPCQRRTNRGQSLNIT